MLERVHGFRPIPIVLGFFLIGLAGASRAPAQAPPPPQGPVLRDGMPAAEDVVRDMKRAEGLFPIFYFEPSGPGRDPERLLALIPGRLINQDILLATSISQGGSYTGWMWDDYLIRFEVRGRQLALVLPDVRYSMQGGNPVAEVVQKTYNSKILVTVPIIAWSGGMEPLIDLGQLLKSNLAGLPGGGMVRSDLSRWMKKKVFQDNVLIEVELALAAGQGANLMGVAYAFRRLPDPGIFSYAVRGADDRVGYFLTARRDWTKRHDARELFDRYINRWNLKKKDPNLELSPPEQPITFIIEKTVPVQWRRSVRQGIEEWNKAFEKIGFTDAIQVLQQTNDNDQKDIDPEDARYNFFRWIVSGNAFAMGPSRVDPRTGQILDADIIFDDSMVRYWIQEFDLFSGRAIADAKGPGFREFLERHPTYRIPCSDSPAAGGPGARDEDPARKALADMFAARGQHSCDFSIGLQHQIALGYYMMAAGARNPKIPERLIAEAIRETVTHEIGHTLGLRHNFKASSWLTVEEIKKRRSTNEATAASIMDYNPILFFADDAPDFNGNFVTPTIGPYDYWAVEYGYKVRGPADKGEEEMLAAIAGRCAEPGLAYATDEETMWTISPDPLVARFDMSSEPFLWAQERIKLADRLLPLIAEVASAPGESRYFVTRAFETLLAEKGRAMSTVSRWIGGQFFNRDHKGDLNGRQPLVLVGAQKQRDAMALLGDTILRDGFLSFPPELLNQLAPPRWMHWGASTPARLDYPIHDRIRILQWNILSDILSPPVLQRIYDAELKSSEADRYMVTEYLAKLTEIIWGKVGGIPTEPTTDGKPFLSSTLRGLQREHLELFLDMVLSPADGLISPDLHATICGAGRDLSARIAATLKEQGRLDGASRAHLMECRSRLDRALDAQFTRRG